MEIAAKERQVSDQFSVGKGAIYVRLKSGAGPAYAGKWVVAILVLNRNEVTFHKSLIGNTFFEIEINYCHNIILQNCSSDRTYCLMMV